MRKQIKDIAVIGHACRFPGGADSPEAFWELLVSGTDAVSTLPEDRFDQRIFLHPNPAMAGKSYTFAAGTLGDVSGFDADFFGISPREAGQIDPQQRLLLELTWEAFERAGQVADKLAGSPCAVYVGISGNDYAEQRMGDAEGLDAYCMLGATLSIAANRISYVFDLNGPSLAVDTACSSSLVALHEAVHALRSGRAQMSVVGGINLLLSPHPFVGFAKAGMLAPYGKCRAFDKIAQGYVRAEGGGVVLLKPLADAERDGDPIVAVIRNVGVNTDGRTHGIALPSSERQEALLDRVYREARISPRDLSYLEAHGTGTVVGDPAEAGAIGRALGKRRPKSEPLLIGSVKSNIGHLEPASGMAGLIKSIEMLRHGIVPPTLHQDEPNPNIPFDDLGLRVVSEVTPLPRRNGRYIIGINSFGFGGANAHAVIQSYAPAQTVAANDEPVMQRLPFVLSARSEKALAEMARRTAELLGRKSAGDWRDIAYTASCRRSHHQHRFITRAESLDEARASLNGFLAGDAAAGQSGQVLSRDAKLALVFVGNGSQWSGMGRRLYAEDEHFRAAMERVEAVARWRLGWSIIQVFRGEAEAAIDDTRIAQPLLLALQIGLIECLRARGLQFDAVLGHSVGEVAAAYASGALSLEQAFHVIRERSNAQGKTRGTGRMLAVSLGAEAAAAEIEPYEGAIEIAAVNSPRAVTLSGDLDSLRVLDADLKERGISHQLLDLDYAFHSRLQDATHDEVLKGLADLKPRAERTPFYSAVSGDLISGEDLGAQYWWRNIREPVRFGDAIAAMARDGIRLFLEIGPHPLLQGYTHQQLKAQKVDAQPVSSLSKTDDGALALDRAIERVFVLGADLEFGRVFPGGGKVVRLPPYPWQRERFWHEPTPEARGTLNQRQEGVLLGTRIDPRSTVWENHFDPERLAFLADHQVGGSIVVPAAVYVEMALEAAAGLFGDGPVDIEDIEILRPMVLETGHERVVRFTWVEEDRVFRIESRPRMRDEAWSMHVQGRMRKGLAAESSTSRLVLKAPTHHLSQEEHYAFTRRRSFDYGPAFTVVQDAEVGKDEAIVRLAASGEPDVLLASCRIPPALLDGALQAIFTGVRDRQVDEGVSYIPQKIGRFIFYPGHGTPCTTEISLIRENTRSFVMRCILLDAAREVVAELHHVRLILVELGRRERSQPSGYRTEVVPLTSLRTIPVPAQCQLAVADTIAASVGAPPVGDHHQMLNRIASAFAADALIALGDAPIPPGRERTLARTIALVETTDGGGTEAALQWRNAVGSYPEAIAELTLVGRAGSDLANALRSIDDDVPAAGAAVFEHLYDSAPTFAVGNDALADAVGRLVDAWPKSRRLRVLELGAGSGGLSHRLVARLPEDRFDLVLVDRDEDAVAGLNGRFATNVDIRVVKADFTLPPDQLEPLAGEKFDLIVGAYALMEIADRSAVFETIRNLSAPGAIVLLAEVASAPWLEFVFGSLKDIPAALLSADEFRSLAEAAQLRDVSVAGVQGVVLISATAPMISSAQLSSAESRLWALLVSPSEHALAEALMPALMEQGIHAVRLDAREADGDVWHIRWNDILRRHGMPQGLVHLAGLQQDAESTEQVLALQECRCGALLAALQGYRAANPEGALDLAVVTQMGLAVEPSQATSPGQAPLIGLARVLRNEFGPCRVIDLRSGDVAALVPALVREIAVNSDESEVLLDVETRFGLRLKRTAIGTVRDADGDTIGLTTKGGSLDNLRWQRRERTGPDADELEIAVKYAGLNFRDVMFALGALPEEVLEDGFAGASLGMEASGVVSRVGKNVSDLVPGDRVLCFAPASLASHAVTKRFAVAKLPDGVDFVAGATLTTAFFTVVYALGRLARIAPGERVLIHGAAGGVGIAAIQYARHAGAEIFATAGSEEKRQIVELHGVPADHIFDSRTIAFADQVMAATKGEGIDVVLNSIAGDAVQRSLSLLKPFGRFLELGKVDYIANTRVGLRAFRKNISYFGVDADQLMAEKPDVATAIFSEMVDLFSRGVLHPLPYRVFPQDQMVEAFRHLQQSRHIGKIVLEIAVPEARVAAPRCAFALDPEASYLITGGLRGFGLATAKWLAGKGARHLVLVSRSGIAEDSTEETLANMRAEGVTVQTRACDVSDERQIQTLVAELSAGAHPLRGLVHAAAVYDDAFLPELTPERLRSVLAPKAGGAWALHRATLGLPLDFFLMYSSISALIGNPGQANYVAANMFLESLAALRRSQGLAATVASLPPIADAGYLTRNDNVAEGLTRFGVRPMKAADVFAWLDRVLDGTTSATLLADVDWRKLGAMPALADARFRNVAVKQGEGVFSEGHIDLATLARELGPDALVEMLLEMLARQIGAILRIAPEKLDAQRSIFDLGMDSLMGLELRMSIAEEFGIELSPMALSQDVSIRRVAEMLCDEVLGREAPRADAVAPDTTIAGTVETERNALLSRHNEVVSADFMEDAVRDLAQTPPAQRGRLIQ